MTREVTNTGERKRWRNTFIGAEVMLVVGNLHELGRRGSTFKTFAYHTLYGITGVLDRDEHLWTDFGHPRCWSACNCVPVEAIRQLPLLALMVRVEIQLQKGAAT